MMTSFKEPKGNVGFYLGKGIKSGYGNKNYSPKGARFGDEGSSRRKIKTTNDQAL